MLQSDRVAVSIVPDHRACGTSNDGILRSPEFGDAADRSDSGSDQFVLGCAVGRSIQSCAYRKKQRRYLAGLVVMSIAPFGLRLE